MKKFYLLKMIILTLAITTFAACSSDSDGDETSYSLSVNKSEFKNIAFEGKTLEFEIKSNTNWTITGAGAWMHPSETSGSGDKVISVKVDAYNDTEAEVRTATLTIKGSNVEGEKKITFSQNPKSLLEAILKVNIIKYKEVEAKGQTIKGFMITSNVPWKIVDTAPWIHLSETEGTGDAKPIITVDACEEVGDFPRNGTFTVMSDKTDTKWTVTIEQMRVPPLNVLDEIEDEMFALRVKMALNIKDDPNPFVSVEKAKTITSLSIYSLQSAKGLEYFTGLTQLDINSASVKTLDLSALVNLKKLYLRLTTIEDLNISALVNLTELQLKENSNLSDIDLSMNKKLEILTCQMNALTTLSIGNNTLLTRLDCNENKLTTLDVSKNTILNGLDCSNNKLTTLDVSKNVQLTSIGCSFNNLTSLDISKSVQLTSIGCSNNKLTTLDISKNTKLENLQCNNNPLSTLYVWWSGGQDNVPQRLYPFNIPDGVSFVKK